MIKLQRHLEKITRSHQTGSRVCKLNENTLAVYDCPEWGVHLENDLYREFPNTTVAVKSCHNSLSGFILLVTQPKVFAETAWALVVTLLLTVLIIMFRNSMAGIF
jgi:hypothetical protein